MSNWEDDLDNIKMNGYGEWPYDPSVAKPEEEFDDYDEEDEFIYPIED